MTKEMTFPGRASDAELLEHHRKMRSSGTIAPPLDRVALGELVKDWAIPGVTLGAGIVALGYALREAKEPSREERRKRRKKINPSTLSIKGARVGARHPGQEIFNATGLVLGIGGGLLLTRAIAKKIRRKGVDEELETAHQELDSVLSDALQNEGLRIKQSSIFTLLLDRYAEEKYNETTKLAFSGWLARNIIWPTAGLSALVAAMAGYQTYKSFESSSPHKQTLKDMGKRDVVQALKGRKAPVLVYEEPDEDEEEETQKP